MDWKTINSAPKDCTPILVYGFDGIVKHAVSWWWSHPEIEGHWTCLDGGYLEPTHWMPLPDKPLAYSDTE